MKFFTRRGGSRRTAGLRGGTGAPGRCRRRGGCGSSGRRAPALGGCCRHPACGRRAGRGSRMGHLCPAVSARLPRVWGREGSSPPSARPLLSPSLPGTGEARATACAPQAPEPCADGLSKSVSDGVLVLRQQLIKVLILENKKAGLSKLPLAGFCLGQPALPQTFYPVCWRCSGWAGAACGMDAQLRPSCHSVHSVTPHR